MTEFLEGKIIHKQIIAKNVIYLKIHMIDDFNYEYISFFVYIYDENNDMKRPYSPIKCTSKELHFIIKIYDTEGVSSYINTKDVNDILKISSPNYKLKFSDIELENCLMIAGGTGVTPMLQILNKQPRECKVKFTLVMCSNSISEIIINKEIIPDHMNLDIFHVIENEETIDPECSDFHLINESMLFFGNLNHTILGDIHTKTEISKYDRVYVCGTDGFLELVSGSKTKSKAQGELAGILKYMGYSSEEVYKF